MKQKIIHQLKASGHRITPARKAILNLILTNPKPFQAVDLLIQLKHLGQHVNKTTIYREIEFLLQQGIIHKLNLTPGQTHYESSFLDHHHHLICNNCTIIYEIDCPGFNLKPIEQQAKQYSFQIQQPSIEFHGLCQQCQ